MGILCFRSPKTTLPRDPFRFYFPHSICSTILFLLKLMQHASTQVIYPKWNGQGLSKMHHARRWVGLRDWETLCIH